ncbi:virion structural protein [Serratia phage Parlo]|uniref:Intramolecular chaperone auto-processing domain-containing protein n=1 Tax=Serratia phage Parlo TaxID=2557554 RepID=A0A482MI43_9CAUD|nr:virion structural protein [Serratia phage Parlo]QBQ72227.1 intramolecular chaperone auto-processing domain-containing protein [Serratia phage Parlo]
MQLEFSMMLTLATMALITLRPQLAFQIIDAFKPEADEKPERKAWEDLLMFKKGSSSAPSPDPRIGEAALKQAELGQQSLDFWKDQMGIANERQKGQDAIANQVTQQQLDASKQAQQWATEDRNRWNTVFKPMQDEFIDTAKNWDSEERQNKLAAEASADVLSNAAQQRDATNRQQAAMGVDPRSGRYQGVDRAAELATGLNVAGAQNNARNTVRKEGVAMKADAINMGSGLAVNPATSLGLGVSSGSAAMGTTSANNAQAAGHAGMMQNGFNSAMQGQAGMASALNNQYSNQLNAWSAQQQANANSTSSLFGGLGSIAGMGLMAFSSKDYKEDKKPIEGGLDAVNSMPVEEWKYKDGIADGGEHIGPYAEDFQKATGKGNGKMIPVMDAVGVTMKAVQELDKKVEALGRSVKRPARAA